MDAPPPGAGDPLQFDKAEPLQPAGVSAALCEACKRALQGVYYSLGGKRICDVCQQGVRASAASRGAAAGFALSVLLGLGAALLGGGVWWGIRAATGYDIGLIAIGVGYLVGSAVRKGSGGWGGLRFQVLALAFTYLGIVFSVTPEVIRGLLDRPAASAPAPAPEGPPPAAAPAPESPEKPTAQGCLGALVAMGALLMSIPILLGKASPIMILIMGFGLWEAWKLNRPAVLDLTGPHRLGPSPGDPGAA